jgi:glycosyltransferase involved in cell wall biosynthesis
MMRLAIDARNLIRSRSGISRSIEAAVLALTDEMREIHLCLPEALHPDFSYLSLLPNLHVHESHRSSAVGRLHWGHTDLPAVLHSIKPSVFWGPAHRLSRAAAEVAPSIVTIHDLVWKFAPKTMPFHRRIGDKVMTIRALARADHIIAVSDRTATSLTNTFSDIQQKLSVVPNIVAPFPAPEDAQVLKALGIGDNYCLFVGTVEPRKNLVRTIRAYLGLRDEIRSKLQVVIAGDLGWKTRDVEEILESYDSGVVFLGPVTEQRLGTLYAHSRFVVMPSLYEGFGYPAIEAKQFGKLLLTSRDSPMADISGPGTVLVDPLDEASIAAGFEHCFLCSGEIDQPQLRRHAALFEGKIIAPALVEAFQLTIQCRQRSRVKNG